jgi:CubicO group peptidase (beta-lactamase class C family)
MTTDDTTVKALTALVIVPAAAALLILVIVPRVIRATAMPVHADAANVPVHPAAPVEPRFASAAEESDRLARTLAVAENLPGLSVAVGVDGRLVWASGFGWAHVEEARPVTPETPFRIGSLSHVLTAAGAGRLIAHGQLDIDAPVQRYLPTLPAPLAAVTTRQAMAHTAGIRHFRGEDDYMTRRHCARLDEALAHFAADRLEFTPGTAWDYSAYGWVLVSAVVEAAAGEPLNAFMARKVFAPLGMQHTLPDATIIPADADDTPLPHGQAQRYWPRGMTDITTGLELPDVVGDVSCFAGAGVYLSTPVDLVRFGLAMDANALFDAGTRALLETPVMLPSGETTGFGLGWQMRRVPFAVGEMAAGETPLLTHPGFAVGGTTVFQRYPEHGVVVAVSSNVSFAELAPFAAQVAALFAAARNAH